MTIRERDVDQLAGAIRHMIEALMDQRDGRIAGGETVTTAQRDLRDAISRAIGMKESAEP
jgi:hypothetical protein